MKPYYDVKVMVNNTLLGDAEAIDETEMAEILGSEEADRAIYEVLYGTGAYTNHTPASDLDDNDWTVFVAASKWTEA